MIICLKIKKKQISFKLYWFNGHKSIIIFENKEPYLYRKGQKVKREKEQEIGLITWKDANSNNKIDEGEEEAYNKVEAKGNGATLSFILSEGIMEYFNEYSDLQLFMSVTYDGETVDLPEEDEDLLEVTPKVKEIYVKLLNYQISQLKIEKLRDIGGGIQYIRGNNDNQSEKVNMDYFSVRIDKLPRFTDGNIIRLYKKIRENFLTLSKGNVSFGSHSKLIEYQPSVNGKWEFKPYPKKDDSTFAEEQLRRWRNELGDAVFFIEAGGKSVYDVVEEYSGDHGAVLESECDVFEMCWIFTTIVTEKSETQPFSGHRQFGIHLDEDGCYRFFTRAIDRVWPSERILLLSENKDAAVKDYLTIADGTWTNLIKKVSKYINNNGGQTTIMQPEIVRINFQNFLEKYDDEPNIYVGNIPQYKEYEK